MPLGLDPKSLVIGAVIGALVVPRVLSAVAAAKAK